LKKKLLRSIEKLHLPKFLFFISLFTITILYGFFAFPLEWFPFQLINNAVIFINEKTTLPYGVYETEYTSTIPIYDKDKAYKSLSLVTAIAANDLISAKIINMEGEVVHEWLIDWFDLWPYPTHIPEDYPYLPKERPGTVIDGAVLLENGDLIFNFSNLGMMKLDICGNIDWRLPYFTHHSIYLDEDGILWAAGNIYHEERMEEYPQFQPPVYETTIIKVSLEGEIIEEISVLDLLKKNDLIGLYFLSDKNDYAEISDDPLHLNDVKPFPSSMEEGIFHHGDIVISIRNRNTIIVFQEEELKVTQVITGGFVRQHDPDFLDGNTLSVFDNNSIAEPDYEQQSSIRIINLIEGTNTIYYTGNAENYFYSEIRGRHQWLPNGNLLVTDTNSGRAFEVDQNGNIVWEYVNFVGDGFAGYISEVSRLPVNFTEKFFNLLNSNCEANTIDG